jgi:uncharacterized protein YdbL (DUF1318 family)
MRRALPLNLLLAVLLAACVTVNVYFPAAAAQSAADQVIDTIMQGSKEATPPQGQTPSKPQGSTLMPQHSVLVAAVGATLNALVPAAQAQSANLDVNTPEVRAIVGSLANRNGQLRPYFASGAIGLTADGHVEVRDQNAVPLPDRAKVKSLVADENRDRDALYAEVAKANGHPEWKSDIQNTFAKRWIAKAESGTWYQDGGSWKQK